ncbi:deoxyribose-phosphate aldolase [Veillonella seminalis]|uniref:deoxyribose-phosphate aldolase n=1 Tax=Veillonella seminalis TaxID=1502943 RepID=UPI00402A653F
MDHTLLKATADWAAIQQLVEEAVEFETASVCIPPSYVKPVYEKYGEEVTICTVIGFPLGYMTTAAKVAETKQAVADGASEIDMVINLGMVKNGHYANVVEEIKAIKAACGKKVLKVIIETCYLTEAEKIALCQAVTDGGADFIKTSTGFGTAGATLDDVLLFKKHIGAGVKIKAAGGIRSIEDMVAYLTAGCDRIGASAAVGLLTNRLDETFKSDTMSEK